MTRRSCSRTLRGWWLTFVQYKPKLPHGRTLPELTLTIPIGRHLLHGRFDLLVVGEKEDSPFAQLYDWKTGKLPDETTLRHDWQTRLYLAMGWLVVLVIGPVMERMQPAGLSLIVAGGVAYTVGVAFYAARGLKFHHLIWHVFVLLGSACHVLAALWYAAA